MKLTCSFTKDRKGKKFFERSLDKDTLTLLLILCDDVEVLYKKNRNTIRFIFHKPGLNTFVEFKKVKDYIAQQVLPMEEWKSR